MRREATTSLPTEAGHFTAIGYVDRRGTEHLALVHGEPRSGIAMVRIHSECLTGDAFGSRRCDCGPQLQASMRAIVAEGSGAVIYLRDHEGRGIGLVNKLRAYAWQDRGLDTVDANLVLGLPVDARDYRSATAILRDLGIEAVRLLTNNPEKVSAVAAAGIDIRERVALRIEPGLENVRYLRTKHARMGHLLGASDA
ncbi:GTP cyclohydrolase II [Nocardioides sp. CPCC 206347]|uniref:GTP cyclohydrolase II n=1 Tax=Nocardioides sp. CPCC 206347 TaxID=3406463 RepID=UPI003B43C9FD